MPPRALIQRAFVSREDARTDLHDPDVGSRGNFLAKGRTSSDKSFGQNDSILSPPYAECKIGYSVGMQDKGAAIGGAVSQGGDQLRSVGKPSRRRTIVGLIVEMHGFAALASSHERIASQCGLAAIYHCQTAMPAALPPRDVRTRFALVPRMLLDIKIAASFRQGSPFNPTASNCSRPTRTSAA